MLQAVLLDLDNTLVIFDEPRFYSRFFLALHPYFQDLMSADELSGRIIRAVGAMVTNSGERSNMDHFLANFSDGLGTCASSLWRRFMEFYERDYASVEAHSRPAENAAAVVAALKSQDLKLVIASNPIFPQAAQLARLKWAALNPDDFDLITAMENMSYVKPRRGYYAQICRKIGVPAAGCLMVGNDIHNDMPAARAGLKTYLTTDAAPIDYSSMAEGDAGARKKPAAPRADKEAIRPDFRGPLAELPVAVAELVNNGIPA